MVGTKPTLSPERRRLRIASRSSSVRWATITDVRLLWSGAASSALAGAGVIATLLPCASFFLKLGRFAPARDLIGAGVPVALATDVNPGGGFSPSMPFAMALACFAMELTFEEALVAATINAAGLNRTRMSRVSWPRMAAVGGTRLASSAGMAAAMSDKGSPIAMATQRCVMFISGGADAAAI